MPLKTVLHGELWDKNILFHEISSVTSPKRSGTPRDKMGAQTPDITKLSNGPCCQEDEAHLSIFRETKETKDLMSKLPSDIMLSDWKFTCVGTPTLDLATLILTTTPSQKFRLDHTPELLQRYFKVFTDKLNDEFGVNLKENYPDFNFDVFVNDFEASLYGALLQVGYIFIIITGLLIRFLTIDV